MAYITATINWIDFSWVSRIVYKITTAIEHRAQVNRTIKELSALSDLELHDIGIHRSQIRSIAEGNWN